MAYLKKAVYAVMITILIATTLASAAPTQRVALLGGADLGIDPEQGGHGFGLVAYDLDGWLPRQGHFSIELNTDTLRLRTGRFSFLGGRLELGAALSAQALFAGILTDYFQRGKKIDERGFYASYLQGSLSAKVHLPLHQSLELVGGFRKWIFSTQKSTSDSLVLPVNSWVFEPRLVYTLWWIKEDLSLAQRHRPFPRVRGVAFGASAGLDVRSDVRPWGALASQGFASPDARNNPDRTGVIVRQWLRAGIQMHSRVRAQLFQNAFYGTGIDDLSRVRIGGMNPYVVPVAGVPWAAFVADRLVAAEGTLHLRIYRELEAGVLANIAWIDDIDRTGASDGATMVGVGLFADLQIEAFQIDIRAGWSPTLDDQGDNGQFGLFAALGWTWESME